MDGQRDEIQRVLERLDHALSIRSAEEIGEVAYDFESLAMESSQHVVELATALIRYLGDPAFQEAEGVWRVLFALQHDFEVLEPDDARHFYLSMLQAYPCFSDWMSAFTITELAEYFPFDWTCDAYELLTGQAVAHRQFLPHAFEHILLSASQETVMRRAYDNLLRLSEDHDEVVRQECALSLFRISNRDTCYAQAARDHLETLGNTGPPG